MSKWSNVVIDDCCDILDHLRVPVNGQDRQNLIGDVPYYGANGLQGYINDFIFNEDLILIAEDGGNFEEHDTRPIAYKISGKSWVNNHAHILKAKAEYSQDYIFYSLVHKNIVRFIAGGTRSKLNKSELIKIPIYCPENPVEQQKIAKILSTTDSVIKKTKTAIAKYKAIKQGMLNDLFTRGIDIKTGKLRPKYEDAPDLYKESELGWIPKEWDEFVFGEMGYTYGGLTNKTIVDFGFGKHFIPYMNIFSNGKINPKFLFLVNINPGEKQNTVKYGDLFFTTSSETVEEVGMTSVLLDEIGEAYLNSFCFGFRLDNFDDLLPEFAAFLFRGIELRKKISLFGQGSTRYNLPKTELLAKLRISLPSIVEQRKILERLLVIESKIQTEQNYLQKLQQIKSGLMADLLSGNKLVSIPKEMETQTT